MGTSVQPGRWSGATSTPRVGVERAAAADPDAVDLAPVDAARRDRGAAELEQARQAVVGPAHRLRRRDEEPLDAAGRVHDARRDLRAADVQAEPSGRASASTGA